MRPVESFPLLPAGPLLVRAQEALSPSSWLLLRDFLSLPNLTAVEKASVAELIGTGRWEEIEERFGTTLSFGTGGIRSRTIARFPTAAERGGADRDDPPRFPAVGSGMLNERTVRRTSLGFGEYLRTASPGHPISVVIAYDTRLFSALFAEICAETFQSLGFVVWLFSEERPTPELSFAIRKLSADAGVMVTASHNPPWDNGLKIYLSDGGQITAEAAEEVSRSIGKISLAAAIPEGPPPGILRRLGADCDQAYFEAIESTILESTAVGKASRAIKVVYTPLHGVGLHTVPRLLARQGISCSLVAGQDTPDGRFPGVASPNPEDPRSLAQAIDQARTERADLVLGTDPDADRLGAAVYAPAVGWRVLTGNQIAALLAFYRCDRIFSPGGKVRIPGTPVLLKTLVTTDLLRSIAEAFGLRCVETLTGFKYLAAKLRRYEEMAEKDPRSRRFLVFGGEESHGSLSTDRVREKDGNAAALQLVEAAGWAADRGMTLLDLLDALYRRFGFFAEELHTLALEGPGGSERRRRLLASFRETPPAGPDGAPPILTEDFGREDHWDADGELLPKEEFLRFSFPPGARLAVRCSGTEPKIKFYLFHRSEAEEDLRAQEGRTQAMISSWWRTLETDVGLRLSR
ncbi:phosphoglucomutase [Methylacidimicrobium cyclopophantes]|uniref:Phosphoglucomutase n=1 Tax=Methylacidimicrobium cyclopophantes TaxID=1041766 RepID=A0A5E6M6T8_9BACT|nr:phospho-sugar mutase [Methylacidimicrobium cyclopophantes]VVM04660.1 phosphoglucomutase [Methylacidimicrobium cyclopophantes]